MLAEAIKTGMLRATITTAAIRVLRRQLAF